MNSITVKKLNSELAESVHKGGIAPGIHVMPTGDDVRYMDAVIMGPEETPYEGGCFHFKLEFSEGYPFRPPIVKLVTTDRGRVRFSPNFYADGHVCLSILGTWEGPQWSSAQTLRSVLVSVQSLMSAVPLINEPGFENETDSTRSKRYSTRIRYETLRVAFYQQLTNPTVRPSGYLHDKMLSYFREKTSGGFYLRTAETLRPFQDQHYEDLFNEMEGVFRTSELIEDLKHGERILDTVLQKKKEAVCSENLATERQQEPEDDDEDGLEVEEIDI